MPAKRNPTNDATNRILNYFLRIGALAWRQNVLPVPTKSGRLRSGGKSGLPDVLGIYGGKGYNYQGSSTPGRGIAFGVEIKRGRDKIRPEQEGFHTQARKLGAIIIVATGLTADDLFNSFLEQWKQITTQK